VGRPDGQQTSLRGDTRSGRVVTATSTTTARARGAPDRAPGGDVRGRAHDGRGQCHGTRRRAGPNVGRSRHEYAETIGHVPSSPAATVHPPFRKCGEAAEGPVRCGPMPSLPREHDDAK
jgi:hypothetical protein